MSLSERQVKIWFQNRRAKERKQNKKKEEVKNKDTNGQNHHSTSGSTGTGGQVPGAQTTHHMLTKEGLMINGTLASSNVQTGGLSGMVSPTYGTVLSNSVSNGIIGETGLGKLGISSPSAASSPSSPTYPHLVHSHHQLNHLHHNSISHQPHTHLSSYNDPHNPY